eukprot:TRINITY_DN4042_c0_g1_i1.p2 TRINITY_DN4042_c0_g1~~TRINITY_DN4042_c0_g1_i1.p2  ORF type:complete len:171 (+),score=51.78 TRINITY_DN4042_c0_g1_i1:77-514(+)
MTTEFCDESLHRALWQLYKVTPELRALRNPPPPPPPGSAGCAGGRAVSHSPPPPRAGMSAAAAAAAAAAERQCRGPGPPAQHSAQNFAPQQFAPSPPRAAGMAGLGPPPPGQCAAYAAAAAAGRQRAQQMQQGYAGQQLAHGCYQ